MLIEISTVIFRINCLLDCLNDELNYSFNISVSSFFVPICDCERLLDNDFIGSFKIKICSFTYINL